MFLHRAQPVCSALLRNVCQNELLALLLASEKLLHQSTTRVYQSLNKGCLFSEEFYEAMIFS